MIRLVIALVFAATMVRAANVGFRELSIPDGANTPLVVGVWYPTAAVGAPTALGPFTQTVAIGAAPSGGEHPLIIMSHGTGGWYGERYDTALALAQAGFVVAAVSHTGDTYYDHSRSLQIADRPRHLMALTDYMLDAWPNRASVNVRAVGAFGFSAGGFTVLATIGGIPDLSRMAAHCLAHPGYFDCQMLKAAAGPRGLPPATAWLRDRRVKSAVIAAPALGFAFDKAGLSAVALPVQLWRAENDHVLPNADYAEAVRLALPTPPESHVVANADHYDFLSPCTEQLRAIAPDICVSRAGFDRVAFHAAFNRTVVEFFERTLR